MGVDHLHEDYMPKTALQKNSYAMKLREILVIRARQYINDQSMTQAAAAQAMGVSQPRISDLMRGKSEKFSLDMLVTMLERVDIKVAITV